MESSRIKPATQSEVREFDRRLIVSLATRLLLVIAPVMILTPVMTGPSYYSATSEKSVSEEYLPQIHQKYKDLVRACTDGSLSLSQRVEYEEGLLLFVSSGDIGWIGFTVVNSSDPCLQAVNGPGISHPDEIITFSDPDLLESLTENHWSMRCGSYGSLLSHSCPGSSGWTRIDTSSYGDSFYFTAVSQTPVSWPGLWWSLWALSLLVLVTLGTLWLFSDVVVLLLTPIRQLQDKIESIRVNPQIASDIPTALELKFHDAISRVQTSTSVISSFLAKRRLLKLVKDSSMESRTVERVIVKISELLSLGFGPSGSGPIVENPLIDSAVFCTIRVADFTTVSSVLGPKIILFVNQICEVIYGIVDEYLAASVQPTSGGGFLVIWKPTPEIRDRSQLFDLAVGACVKIQIAINRSIDLMSYREYPPLMQAIANYRLKLDMGLHCGWAVEGTVGSALKTDPVHMSPDVVVAGSLERAHTEYRTEGIFASEKFISSCSPEIQTLFIPIDSVTFLNKSPVVLYLLEIHPDTRLLTGEDHAALVALSASRGAKSPDYQSERAFRKRRKPTMNVFNSIVQDSHYPLLVGPALSDPATRATLRNGFLNYQAGEWSIARTAFERLTFPHSPSKIILEFMHTRNYIAPESWPGYRSMT
jgi:hypothetical protein